MSYEEIKFRDGSFRREWRNISHQCHREDGPAYIHYYPNGSIQLEYFCFNGIFHREDGPAKISYYADGSIEWEIFYLNGKLLSENKGGFWRLWDKINKDERKNPTLLKYLAKYS